MTTRIRSPHNRTNRDQANVVRFCDDIRAAVPALAALYAIPNGGFQLPHAVAGRLVRDGLRKGFPDLGLAVPCGTYGGAFFELKAATRARRGYAELSLEQRHWLELLAGNGFYAAVCFGPEATLAALADYLGPTLSRPQRELFSPPGKPRDGCVRHHHTPTGIVLWRPAGIGYTPRKDLIP